MHAQEVLMCPSLSFLLVWRLPLRPLVLVQLLQTEARCLVLGCGSAALTWAEEVLCSLSPMETSKVRFLWCRSQPLTASMLRTSGQHVAA